MERGKEETGHVEGGLHLHLYENLTVWSTVYALELTMQTLSQTSPTGRVCSHPNTPPTMKLNRHLVGHATALVYSIAGRRRHRFKTF